MVPMKSMKKIKLKLILIFLSIAHFICLNLEAKSNYDHNSEPLVSKKEAAILNEVSELAKTDILKAIDLITGKIYKDSSSALDFTAANLYFQNNNFNEAKHYYQQALQKRPMFNRAKENLVRILIQEESYAPAFSILNDIINSNQSDHGNLLLMGFVLMQMDKICAAKTIYNQAILKDPDEIQAYLGLAKCLLLQERNAEAIPVLREILSLNPLKKDIWSLLSNCYMANDKLDKAISTLETSKILKIIDEKGLITLGDLYLNQNQVDDALDIFKQCLNKENVEVSRLIRAVNGFVLLEEYKKAQIFLEKILKSKTPLDNTYLEKIDFLQAKIFFHQGKSEEALVLYLKVLKRNPLNGECLISIGDLYLFKKKPVKARISFERAASLKNFKQKALVKLALLEVELKHFDQALQLLEKAQNIKYEQYIANYVNRLKMLLL